MTTTEFGGGPNLSQRRLFAAYRDGSHVPGYQGYITRLKYRNGQTYGTDTHELFMEKNTMRRPVTLLGPYVKEPLTNKLPVATGDNRYTEQMIPGYTGYIPRMLYKFGGTYAEDCDICIDENMTNRNQYDIKAADLQRQTDSYPRLTAIGKDPEVRDRLNLYRDTHPIRSIMMDDKRALTEPPIPGYRGYIPKIKQTELGLACRYNQMCQKGLESFYSERTTNLQSRDKPVTIDRSGLLSKSAPSFSHRIYQQDGMIPKYTGYIPHRRYRFGNTYGDTTRDLECCSHDKSNYGEHINTKAFYRSATAM